MRERLTISEAARRLEVPEAKVRDFKRKGLLEPVGKGRYGAELFDAADVATVGRRLRLGRFRREARRVLVHAELDTQVLALAAGGIDVVRVESLMDALSAHDLPGMPILVLPARLDGQESMLLESIIDSTYTILVGDHADVAPITRRRCTVLEHDALRELVTQAWRLVEIRLEQVNLRL